MSSSTGSLRRSAGSLLIVVVVWELVGKLELIAGGTFPPLSAIFGRLYDDRADYPQHLAATLRSAGIGFAVGSVIAIGCGILFAQFKMLERIFRGVSITFFAVPLIVLVPVLLLAFQGTMPRIILAIIAVYFPVMVSTLIGVRDIDPRLAEVIRVSGGTDRDVMRFVRLRAALPAIFAGLRVGGPGALLGVMLVEFGGGVRWGLGTYLLGSLGRGEPARLWGIGLLATMIAGISYGVFSWFGAYFLRTNLSTTVSMKASSTTLDSDDRYTGLQRLVLGIASFCTVLVLWSGALRLMNLSPVVARGPVAVVRYLFTGARGADARDRLLSALGETLPLAGIGLMFGLLAAFVLALLLDLFPIVGSAFFPFALISQSMPLPALTPLIVLVFGRSVLATVVVTFSVTFFPSYVTIAQALSSSPQGAIDVAESYGARRLQVLRFIRLPQAIGSLLTAARLAAPRALLGVMIAEYLATGNGLGNLLNESRGKLDYGMIWTVGAVSVTFAVLLTQIISKLERQIGRKFLV
ncbi:MAG: ABC transporter permease subunit [Acidimicrobiaceae bacterium]|nr:ABC transporter permease subunit [Acidimicrobiaceae bacterium]